MFKDSDQLHSTQSGSPTKKDFQKKYIVFRNNNQLSIPFTRLATLSKHPLIIFPKTWVEFSNEDIKIIRNKIEFKIKLKKYLLGELSDTIVCNRLLCPSCHLNA